MAFCSACGTEVSGDFCSKCGARHGGDASSVAVQALEHERRVQAYMMEGRVRDLREQLVSQKTKRYDVPALLSFFVPGLGQLVKGQILNGVGIMFFMGLSVAAMLFAVGFVTTPLFWLWNVYDAYTNQS